MDEPSSSMSEFELDLSAQAMQEAGDTWPRVYAAHWTKTGLYQRPRPPCAAATPETRASFRLTASGPKFGHLRVTLTTYDRLGNYPGESTVVLESEVALRPSTPIYLAMPGNRSGARFHWASVETSPATMKIEFSAPWKASSNGRVCHQGENTFSRTINLVRIAIVESEEVREFSQG
jgi:hypothetical protein